MKRLLLLPVVAATFDAARWLGGECGRPQDKNIIVVLTRFMQGQGRFKALVGARLEQMLAVTIPSIKAQTNRCFLWFVSTDPALPPEPRRRLEAALPAHARLVDNPRPLNMNVLHYNRTLRASLLETAFPGVRGRLAAAAELTTIRLDADDALHRNYVDRVARWRRDAPPLSAAATYDFACANRAMAWQSSKTVEGGQRRHAIHLEALPRGCLISGMAHAYALAGGGLVACAPEPCQELSRNHRNARDVFDVHDVAVDAGDDPNDVATAPVFRVRSITSNGGTRPETAPKNFKRKRVSSRRIASSFGINSGDLVSLARYLRGHEAAVAHEMLRDAAAAGCNDAYAGSCAHQHALAFAAEVITKHRVPG